MAVYKDFENYFVELVEAHPTLKSVTFVNDWTEIMDLQLGFDLYPALVIEIPDIDGKIEGGAEVTFDFAYSIIQNTPENELSAFYRNVLDEIIMLQLKLKAQMFCDSEEVDDFDAELDTTFQRIIKATADNCYGWRGSAQLKYHIAI